MNVGLAVRGVRGGQGGGAGHMQKEMAELGRAGEEERVKDLRSICSEGQAETLQSMKKTSLE